MRDNILWKFFSNLLSFKQPVSIRSSFGAEESVRRLSKVVYWPFPNLFRQCLFGTVNEEKVKVRRVIPFVGNSFAPVFYGSFEERDGETVLDGYYAMSLFVRIFNGLWFGFCLCMVPLFLGSAIFARTFNWPPMPQWEARLIFGFWPIGMLLISVIFVRLGKWFARNDTVFIEERLRAALNEV